MTACVNASGWRQISSTPVPQCGGTLNVYQHERLGTRCAWLQREEENKTFAITFRTPPEDDTGVFHILEHTVLNGSRKYPVKEPFVNLLKTSLKTFLNAITFSDMTMFPVSSRNEKDFRHLVDVYLDAVFHPLSLQDPRIFAQEGWHYELFDPAEQPVYKGVVFNEMKGAFASVDEVIADEVNRMLFPDTCYRYVSGGDPEKIPTLSYEQYCQTHARYYHPSNASVYLDGDLDLDWCLNTLNACFADYEPQVFADGIGVQEIRPVQQRRVLYEIAPQESPAGRTHYVMARLEAGFDEIEKITAWNVLSSVLTDNNESPLIKVILDRQLGEDASLVLGDGVRQAILMYAVHNTEEEKIPAIQQAVRETVEDLVHGALQHDQIRAALNRREFMSRDRKEPSGIGNAQAVYSSWLYGGDPTLYLNTLPVYKSLRQKLDEGYFEALLEEAFLSDSMSSLTVVPSVTLGQQKREKEAAELQKAKASWSPEQIQETIAFSQELVRWQAAPDSREAEEKIPLLSLSDVEPDPRRFVPEETEWDGVPVLQYPRFDSGISYLNYYIALNGIPRDRLSEVSVFLHLLMDLPTRQHTVAQLQERIEGELGSLSCGCDALASRADPARAVVYASLSSSFLEEKSDKAVQLMQEVLQETLFAPETVLPLLQQMLEDFRDLMQEAGYYLGTLRALGNLSAAYAAREQMHGLSYGRYLAKLIRDPQELEHFLDDCRLFQEILSARKRYVISTSGPGNETAVRSYLAALPDPEYHPGVVRVPLLKTGREGLIIPSDVAYAVSAAAMPAEAYDGSCQVAAHVLTYDHLWNQVRVQGGAYGTGIRVSRSGTIVQYSYRDPDPGHALTAFRQSGQALARKTYAEKELSSDIIGTISTQDPLLSPGARVFAADMRWLSSITYEDTARQYHEILQTREEDLQACARQLDQALQRPVEIITGSREKIEQAGRDFRLIPMPDKNQPA